MKVDLGIWNNIFSIPTCIVDDHIVRCGSAQIKVLLYLLRYPGREVPVEEIADKLSLSCADVSDSLNYWICEGVILGDNKINNNKIDGETDNKNMDDDDIVPAFKIIEPSEILDNPDKESDFNFSPALDRLKTLNEISQVSNLKTSCFKDSKRFLNSPGSAPRLTTKEALNRIQNDENLKFLMNEVPKILKRSTTTTDIVVIVSFLDWTGMDIDLALMLINYCASTERTSAKLIEKEAYKWANEGINTHEKAEVFIKENLNLIKIQQEIIYAFHKPYLTVREKAFVKKWVMDFKYNINMIKLAYETGLTRKGEKDFSYVNGILLSWYKKGIKKPDEVSDENGVKAIQAKLSKTKNKTSNRGIFKGENFASFSLDDLKAKIEN